MNKINAAILLIKQAMDAGITADYVLMGTLFTTEPMIKEILSLGLDSIEKMK